jgi:starch synthase
VNILSVASEIFPLIKTGGLADVAGALPGALAAEGIAVHTLVPGYPAVTQALQTAESRHEWPDLFGAPARLLAGQAAGLDLFVLDAPHLFHRPGNPYTGADGRDWPDNAQRFAALARAAADIGLGIIPGYSPEIVHGHDWQTGLAPAYLAYAAPNGNRPKTIVTIHNLAFQGQFPTDILASLGLPPWSLTVNGVEYYNSIGYLKAGLFFANHITTVSPTYAAEIVTPDGGMGMDGLLRARGAALSGIVNGIDTTVWDPANDPALAATFSARTLAFRAQNKAALQARFGLKPDPGALLFTVLSRLTSQKGIDLVIGAIPTILAEGGQLAVLGAGDAALQQALQSAANTHAGRIGVIIGYDESLAHLLQGGGDALLVPSRFEPCGLTQLCALRYGAIPIVSRVGGLADTVSEATGLVFHPVGEPMFIQAINQCAARYQDKPAWQAMQRRAMAADVSWSAPARHYAALYRQLAGAKA